MIHLIAWIGMAVAAMVVATRGIGVMIKCINVLFDRINDGLDERLSKRS